MRYFLGFFLLPFAVFAQTAPPMQIAPYQVYQAFAYDFNGDDLDDRVMLIADDEYDNWLSLVIYLSGDDGFQVAGYAPDLIWIDFSPDEKPWLNLLEGEIYAYSWFESPGRVMGEEIFLITYTEGEFRLATYYTYSVDQIDVTTKRECSFELGNGVGTRMFPQEDRQEPFTHDIPLLPIGDISMDMFTDICPQLTGE